MKICSKCKTEKHIKEFSQHRAKPDGLQPYCKECRRLHRAATAKKISEYQILYRAKNPGKRASQQKAYESRFPERRAQLGRNQRAKRRGSEGTHNYREIDTIFNLQRGRCANCHAKLFKSGKKKYHVDHIVAIAKGGSNWPENLQCLCPPCNLSKGAKDPIDWAKKNGRLL